MVVIRSDISLPVANVMQNSDYKREQFVSLRTCNALYCSAMTELAKRTCVPCKGGVPPLKGEPLEGLARQVPGWKVIEEHHLERSYNFSDFVSALEFVKAIGAVAEEQGHHPDILL